MSPLNPNDPNIWKKYKNLTPQTQRNLAPSESSKSQMIQHLYKTQEQVIKNAEYDQSKQRDAHRFAQSIEREIRFIRNK